MSFKSPWIRRNYIYRRNNMTLGIQRRPTGTHGVTASVA